MCAQRAVLIFRKTATQRAKLRLQKKFCLAYLQGNHQLKKCPTARKRSKSNCGSTHNLMLHGKKKVFPPREQELWVANAKILATNTSMEKKTPETATEVKNHSKVSTFSAFLTAHEGFLPMRELEVNSNGTSTKALVLCDSACSNSSRSSRLAKRLNLEGKDLKITVNGINTTEVNHSHKAEITVSSETSNPKLLLKFHFLFKKPSKLGLNS